MASCIYQPQCPKGEFAVATYWTNNGESGYMGSIGGTVGVDISADILYGEVYGSPSLLDGAFIIHSDSIGPFQGTMIMDGSGTKQIGEVFGYSYGPTKIGYHQTVGYGGHKKANFSNVTVPSLLP